KVATTTSGKLIGGKRSTGIRERLVTPITSSVRQITMMKYGLRIENPGIKFVRLHSPLAMQFLLRALLVVLHHGHWLGMNFLPSLQAAAIAYHNLLTFIQAGNDFGIAGGL